MKFYQRKTVWIIGGTSGIGLAIAEKLCTVQSCTVVISGRNFSKVHNILQPHAVKLDVNDNQNFASVVDDILQKYKRVDIILFCAGVYEPMNVDNFNRESAVNILGTNLGSMINFIENLPKFYRKCNMIGVVSSVAGYFGMPNSLFYGASKAGLSHLTESLHIELKKYKIDVKLINPGFVKTPLTEKNTFKMPFIISSEKAAEIILKKLPKEKFEIAFPSAFIFVLKILAKIPFKLRSKLFNI